MVLVCRFHSKYCETEKLHLHLPRKSCHNLSATEGDQLSHCSLQARMIKAMRTGAINSIWSMDLQLASFGGVDLMTVSNKGRFQKYLPLLVDHEVLSLQCRHDIRYLLSRYVVEGVVWSK